MTTRTRVESRGRLGANLVACRRCRCATRSPRPWPSRRCPSAPLLRPVRRQPVGRGRDGRPGKCRGVLPADGTPFSFVPRLSPGEVVNARYEILGALAHGGLGWIYLALDRNVASPAPTGGWC
jgi:serine/threonine-protein kinase PknG